MSDTKETFKERTPIPEIAPTPETKKETLKEAEGVKKEHVDSSEKNRFVSIPAPGSPVAAAQTKDPMLSQIEQLLSDDLFSVYASLPPKAQSEFKSKGEEVAAKIQNMIASAKAVAKDILSLIISWLKIIPGVNSFFLEQEAKIKTDKIMVLAEEEKKKHL